MKNIDFDTVIAVVIIVCLLGFLAKANASQEWDRYKHYNNTVIIQQHNTYHDEVYDLTDEGLDNSLYQSSIESESNRDQLMGIWRIY